MLEQSHNTIFPVTIGNNYTLSDDDDDEKSIRSDGEY
jgi:hypothetical protein